MSSMLDVAHVFKNLLVVFDDPRDCSRAQMSSIVHEAFSGHASSTISKGVRRYHSALIIGTQERFLGMGERAATAEDAATLSRQGLFL